MRGLRGRTALVTGGTTGIGRAVAESLAREGVRLVLHGLQLDQAAEETADLCRQFDVEVTLLAGDLAGPTLAAVSPLVEKAHAQAGNIDLLVSNAGGYFDKPFLETDYDTFDKTMRLNVYSHFFLIQQFAQRWVVEGIGGRVVVTGSINGRLAEPTHACYDTSKGAVEMMVKTLAVELAPRGIRVNGMAPGLIRTPLTAPALDNPLLMQWMKHHTPNGQVPGPEVCGDAVAFLLSDAAQHIHGQMLLVDGGMSAWQQPDPPLPDTQAEPERSP